MSRSKIPDGQREKAPTAMSILLKNKYAIIALTLFVMTICGIYIRFQWNRYQTAASSEAIKLAESVESLLHPEHIAELSGHLEDLDKPEYKSAKSGMMNLVETTSAIKFAYVYGEKDGNLVFLVDSEPTDSADYTPPGEVYYEATDAYWEPLQTGKTVLTAPTTDRWGTWISTLVPIESPTSGEVLAVLGLDYYASAWQAKIRLQIIPDAIIVFILLLLYAALLHIGIHRMLYQNLSKRLEWDEALYHSIFAQAPIGISIVNNEDFTVSAHLGDINTNPMCMQILKRTNRELQNITWTEITHPDDLQAELEQFERFQKGEINGYSLEKRFVLPDGSSVWTNLHVSHLVGLPYSHAMHLCLLEDISSRKETESLLKESERSKSLLVSNLPGLAYRCKYDREWTMLFVSDGCSKLTGHSPDMMLNNNEISFNDIVAPEYREPLWDKWAHVLQKRLPFRAEYEILTADGKRKWVLEMGEGVYNKQGDVEALEGIILDITDRKKSERQLQLMLKRTQSMINNHQAVMLLLEPETGKIIEANSAATDFYGYTKKELLHMTIQDINTMDKEEIHVLRLRAMEKGQRYFSFPHRLKSGEIRSVDVYSSPIEYDNRIVLFSIIFDVTERRKIADQIEFLAYHDYLTGLYNRRFFEEEFERWVKHGKFPIGCFLGDVDGFKEYNDTYGHAEGDTILRSIADDLKVFVGDKGIIARIGGDEFSILVSGMDKIEIRRYLDKLNQDFVTSVGDSPIAEQPTISWGYGFQRTREDTLDSIVAEAEAFMYNRKFYSYQSSRSKTVNTIMETLFTKSEREKQHSERVGVLAVAIAKHMQLSNAEIDKIRVAGFLHDIGKIGIDEAVLNKAGKLDAKEWEMIKLHPAKGAGILEKTHEYQDISDIVLSHHERFDGQGYPGKLQAEFIPLGARIIAVADTFDAITNERPYKKALDKSAAIEELKKSAGAQLDPKIVSVFVNKVLSEMGQDYLQD